jgi:hypothetical protein
MAFWSLTEPEASAPTGWPDYRPAGRPTGLPVVACVPAGRPSDSSKRLGLPSGSRPVDQAGPREARSASMFNVAAATPRCRRRPAHALSAAAAVAHHRNIVKCRPAAPAAAAATARSSAVAPGQSWPGRAEPARRRAGHRWCIVHWHTISQDERRLGGRRGGVRNEKKGRV